MNKKIAIISDLHIGSHSNSETWHAISFNFIKWFKRELISKNINDIIILGDFFDNRNEIGVKTLHVASSIMDELDEFNIKMIAGNHDLFYKNRNDVHSIGIFSGRNNVEIFEELKTEKINDKLITYIPWGSDTSNIKKCDVIFGHLEINGFNMTSGRCAENKIDPKSILKSSNLIFSGHFHLRDERSFSKGLKKIIYTGSPYQLNWGEMSNIPGFYILNIDDLNFEFIENTISPRHIIIKSGKIDTKKIENNIVSVVLEDEDEDEQLNIRNKISSCSPLEYKFIKNQKNINNISLEKNNTSLSQNTDLYSALCIFIDKLDLEDEYKINAKDKLKVLYKKYCA